jgi:hypothetical protein
MTRSKTVSVLVSVCIFLICVLFPPFVLAEEVIDNDYGYSLDLPEGFSVAEYTPNQIKKMIVGAGHADKKQVDMMVRTLLKTVPEKIPADASDALAIALCHSFMRPTNLNKMMLNR